MTRTLASALLFFALVGCQKTQTLEGKVGRIEMKIRGLPGAFENQDTTRGTTGPVISMEFALLIPGAETWTTTQAYPPKDGRYSFTEKDALPRSPTKDLRLHVYGHGLDSIYSAGHSQVFDIPEKETVSAKIVLGPSDGFAPATTSPVKARVNHTVTLLNDNRILIVGGRNETGGAIIPVGPELYDHSSGELCSACLVGDLPADLEHHSATLLPTGEVLIAGGRSSAGVILGTLWLFHPADNRFEKLPATIDPRAGHAAILVADNVLLAGGVQAGIAVNGSQWIDHPASAAGLRAGKNLTSARAFAAQAPLESGDTGLFGGRGPAGLPLDTADVYVASEDKFAEPQAPVGGAGAGRAKMKSPRVGHVAVVLPDMAVLIVGGQNASGLNVAEPEIFTSLYNSPGGFLSVSDTSLPASAWLSAVKLETNEILLWGESEQKAWARRFVPGTNRDLVTALSYDGSFKNLKYPPPVKRSGHAGVSLPDGTALFVGGLTDGKPPTDAADNQPVAAAVDLFLSCSAKDRACQ